MKTITALTGLFLLFTINASAQEAALTKFLESELSKFPDCEVAIGIIDGDQQHKLGYLITDGELKQVNNSTTLFEIASISKTFTAAALANEIGKGTIALDDPLQEHLNVDIKEDTYQGQQLKMVHLVTHTSGLKKNPLTNAKRYLKYLEGFELDYVPGKNWEYNNMTIGLVGQLVAEKNQSIWNQTLRTQILTPLGMTNTYAYKDLAPQTGRVQCLDKKGNLKDCYFHKMDEFHWPAGGIISNVDDMLIWINANMESPSSELDFLEIAHDPLADSVSVPWFEHHGGTQGIVWWHYRTPDGDRILCHGGNLPAQTAFLAFSKAKKKGIIIMANRDGYSLMDEEEHQRTTELAMKWLSNTQ